MTKPDTAGAKCVSFAWKTRELEALTRKVKSHDLDQPEVLRLSSFTLGFIMGTSVYIVATGAGYMLFTAGKRIVSALRR